ncbi:MAG: hypothetical protein RL469_545, partial [Pseudomonadota bacterium]
MPLRPSSSGDRDVYTVGRLNREVRQLLEHGMPVIWIEAELSNFSRPASGHWYFSLKDRDAQVRCAMFKARNAVLRFTPTDGQLVLARGRVGVYEARGEYQLIVEHLEDAGIGALRRDFDRLRAKLEAEGLFAAASKRSLPAVPRRIGVITSPTGAAIRDILNVLGRRFPAADVVIYPTAVQGKAAVPELRAAIASASTRAECDVLIVARGGGSLEDLWAFNDEGVARALRATPMPVVTGIGHEIDFTIADFVADLRAPTPSGAAELVVPDAGVWRAALDKFSARFVRAVTLVRRRDGAAVDNLAKRLQQADPALRMQQAAQRLDELEQRLVGGWRFLAAQARAGLQDLAERLAHCTPELQLERLVQRHALLGVRLERAATQRLQDDANRLALARRGLHAVSPLATLDRGFAIVTREADRKLLRDANEVQPNDVVRAR